MGTRSEKGYTGLKNFLDNLRDLTEALPSQVEKETARAQFQEIVEFIVQMENAVNSLPSREEAEGVRHAIQHLDDLRLRAKTNVALAAALGIAIPKMSRATQRPVTPEERNSAESLLRDLRALSIDEMRRRLESEDGVTSRELQEVAKLVGVKASRRLEREALVHQIVTKISNFRGYQELRGDSGGPPPDDLA
jgi:hypothetical protein